MSGEAPSSTRIDLILVLAGAQTDMNGRALAGYEENKKVAWIVTAAVFVISAISSGVPNTWPGTGVPGPCPSGDRCDADR